MGDPVSTAGGRAVGSVLKVAVGKSFTWRLRLVWLVRRTADFPVPRWRLWKLLRRFKKPYLVDRALAERSAMIAELTAGLSPSRAWKDESKSVSTYSARVADLLAELLPETITVEQSVRIAGTRAERTAQDQGDRLAALVERRLGQHVDPSAAKQLPPYMFADLNPLVEQTDEALTLVDVLLLPDPVPSLKSWAARPPHWLEASSAGGWIAFGYALVAHGLSREAAAAWQQALVRGAVPVDFWQARRALELATEPELALDALPPEAATSTNPFVRGVHGLLAGQYADAIRELECWSPDHQRDRDLRVQLLAGVLAQENRLDEAVAVLEETLPATEGSAIPLLLARNLLERAQLRLSMHRAEDLRRAVEAGKLARDRRRNWRGDSAAAVQVAADALVTAGEMQAAWELLRPEPDGTATLAEADDARLRPAAAAAAAATGRTHIAEELAVQLEPYDQAWVQAMLIERQQPEPDADEQAQQAWYQRLETALRTAGAAAQADDQVLAVGQIAASNGVLLDQLEAVRDRYPTEVANCVELARAAHDLVLLRALSTTSELAAIRLADLLTQQGDHVGAAQVLRTAADRFEDATLRLMAIDRLGLAGHYDDATAEAQRVLVESGDRTGLRQRALQALVELAQQRGDWAAMAAHARELSAIPGAGDDPRWALTIALINQARTDEAWDALRRPNGPPRPTTMARAYVLINLLQRHASANEVVRAGLDALRQFGQDEEFAGFVVQAMIIGGIDRPDNGPPLTAEERADRQQAIDEFFARYPTNPYLQQIDASEPETVIAEIARRLRERADATTEVHQQVVDGILPLGLLAAATRKSYTEAIVSRAGRVRYLQSLDQREQEAERAELRARAGEHVVVDASALHTLTILDREIQTPCLGIHASVIVTDPTLRDILAGRDRFALRATGFFAYDPVADQAVAHQSTQEEADEKASRSKALMELALRQVRQPWPQITELPDLEDPEFAAWTAPMDAAKAQAKMLWSDDLAHRRLARSLGIMAFGTTALLDHLTETGHLTIPQRERALDDLARNWSVDLPFHQDRWRRVAEVDEWRPQAAAMLLSRPNAWTRPAETVRLLDEALNRVYPREQDHEVWVALATLGLLRATLPNQRADIAQVTLGRLWNRNSEDTERFPRILRAVRWAAQQVNLPDPLPDAALQMLDFLSPHIGEATAITHLLTIAQHASQGDRQSIVEAILTRSIQWQTRQ